MSVRSARSDEIAVFYTLWEEYMEEHREFCEVHVSPEALNEAGKLFQAYIGGNRIGMVLFWTDEDDTPQGVVLGGVLPQDTDVPTDWGKYGHLMGLYIRKEHRGAKSGVELMNECCRIARKLGFDTALTVVKEGNTAALAMVKYMKAEPVETCFRVDLERF